MIKCIANIWVLVAFVVIILFTTSIKNIHQIFKINFDIPWIVISNRTLFIMEKIFEALNNFIADI